LPGLNRVNPVSPRR